MAIQAVLKRSHVLKFIDGSTEVGTATITGTYATNGFTVDGANITGSAGTSPYAGLPVELRWVSPSGYIYVSTFGTGMNSRIITTKIFSAPGTELANGTAAPDATLNFSLVRRRLAY